MIAFWISTPRKFSPDDVGNKPFGGSEVSTFNLAKELSNNYEVHIFGDVQNGNKYWHHWNELKNYDIDTLIVVRADNRILNPRYNQAWKGNIGKVILWTGDEHTQPNNDIFHDRWCRDEFDLLVCKSNWQKQDLLKYFPLLDKNKVTVIYNGTHSSDKVSFIRNKPKFICASTIYRGIWHFIEIWPKIRERIPNATLDLYASKKLYIPNSDEKQFYDVYKNLDKAGVNLKNPVSQSNLHHEFRNHFAMLYPNDNFMESSCGSALQAMANGCPVVASARAGLAETVEMGYGYLVPMTDSFVDDFVDKTVEIWENRQITWKRAKKGYDYLKKFRWTEVAKNWEKLLFKDIKKVA